VGLGHGVSGSGLLGNLRDQCAVLLFNHVQILAGQRVAQADETVFRLFLLLRERASASSRRSRCGSR
jgi:hypothetical protein